MKSLIVLSCAGVALAAGRGAAPAPAPSNKHGRIELVSGDLSGSSPKALDNIQGTWSQALKFLGGDATVSAEYDRNENRDFLKQATVSSALGSIKYELTTRFGGAVEMALETTTEVGTRIEAEGEINGLSTRLTKVTGTRNVQLRDQACELELSHELGCNESKLKLSTAVGSGLRAVGLLSSKMSGGKAGGFQSSMSYELEYDTELTKGRTLSAKVSPADGTGEVEYVDSATLDATITAFFPLGGKPSVTAKRAFDF